MILETGTINLEQRIDTELQNHPNWQLYMTQDACSLLVEQCVNFAQTHNYDPTDSALIYLGSVVQVLIKRGQVPTPDNRKFNMDADYLKEILPEAKRRVEEYLPKVLSGDYKPGVAMYFVDRTIENMRAVSPSIARILRGGVF